MLYLWIFSESGVLVQNCACSLFFLQGDRPTVSLTLTRTLPHAYAYTAQIFALGSFYAPARSIFPHTALPPCAQITAPCTCMLLCSHLTAHCVWIMVQYWHNINLFTEPKHWNETWSCYPQPHIVPWWERKGTFWRLPGKALLLFLIIIIIIIYIF